MGDTTIEWVRGENGRLGKTWNPVRGCSRVSPGCVNCYAERQAARFCGDGKPFEGFVKITPSGPRWTGKVGIVEKHLTDPLRWKEPRRVFVNSMSDLFHEGLPDEVIDRVFAVMALAPQHTFQVLTKRAKRMRKYMTLDARVRIARQVELWHEGGMHGAPRGIAFPRYLDDGWPLPNVWLGVSAEDQQRADERIPELLCTPAEVRFVSYEPALGPIDFEHLQPERMVEVDALRGTHGVLRPHRAQNEKLDWVIVGGESGPGARPFDLRWACDTVRQCRDAGVACFVKQLGAKPTGSWGIGIPGDVAVRDRKGGDMSKWPEELRVREYPFAAPRANARPDAIACAVKSHNL